MRQVTGSMAGVVKGMEGAMRSMDLEKVRSSGSLTSELQHWAPSGTFHH